MGTGPLPAFVYCDIACELYPELAPRIREEVANFYADQSERIGEHLIKQGVLTEEQNKLVLLAQKAQRKILDKADVEELRNIQSAVHLRTLSNIEEMGILLQRLRK